MPPSQRNNPSALNKPAIPATGENAEPISASLELEQVLDQVAQQACLATAATASAIALKQGDEIVCCATAGVNTPDLGVRLNMKSGLSAACVQTREPQYCEDTETDPRVDAAACRRLQVRSVLVSPLLQGDELVGVFEVFSPLPQAFATHDLENLETLSRLLLDKLPTHSAAPPSTPAEVEPPAPVVRIAEPEYEPEQESHSRPSPGPPQTDAEAEREFFSSVPKSPSAPPPDSSSSAFDEPPPLSESSPVPGWGPPGPAEAPLPEPESSPQPAESSETTSIFSSLAVAGKARPRDWATGLLTCTVIGLALLLGWMLGRVGWQRAERAARASKTQAESVAPSKPAASPAARNTPSTETSGPDSAPVAAPEKEATVDAARATTPARTPRPVTPQPKNNTDLDSTGGLVVYQDGTVIFQQKSPPTKPGQSATGANASPKQGDAEEPAPVWLSPQLASLRLAQRVEPLYPEQARQNHIQGDVVLDALIGKDGAVQQLTLTSGDPALAAAATDAVRQWRFRPYRLNGKAVAFKTHVTVEFRLP
jgi:TonB family protein